MSKTVPASRAASPSPMGRMLLALHASGACRLAPKSLAGVGVIFMLLIIYAGFGWMTARGNETAVENAKHTLTSASIGLGVILGAYALVQLIEYFIDQSTAFR